MATRFKPNKQRVVIRELGIPARVVDRFGGWVFVRSDSQPEHIAVLRDHEVEFPELGLEQNPPDDDGLPNGWYWPEAFSVVCVTGITAVWAWSLIPQAWEPVIVVGVLASALAGAGWWMWRAWR